MCQREPRSGQGDMRGQLAQIQKYAARLQRLVRYTGQM